MGSAVGACVSAASWVSVPFSASPVGGGTYPSGKGGGGGAGGNCTRQQVITHFSPIIKDERRMR